MIIRYFDKDGKQHSLNLKTSTPVFIASEIEDGSFAEYRVEEQVHFSKEKNTWTTWGAVKLSVVSEHGMALAPAGSHELIMKPDSSF